MRDICIDALLQKSKGCYKKGVFLFVCERYVITKCLQAWDEVEGLNTVHSIWPRLWCLFKFVLFSPWSSLAVWCHWVHWICRGAAPGPVPQYLLRVEQRWAISSVTGHQHQPAKPWPQWIPSQLHTPSASIKDSNQSPNQSINHSVKRSINQPASHHLPRCLFHELQDPHQQLLPKMS